MKAKHFRAGPVREQARMLLDDEGLSLIGTAQSGLRCPAPEVLLEILEGTILQSHELPQEANQLLDELTNLGICGHTAGSHSFPSPFLASAVAVLAQELDRLLVTAASASVTERQRTAVRLAQAALTLREMRLRAQLPVSATAEFQNPIRLNVGSGKNRCTGWVRADLDPSADVVFDVGGVWPFADGAVDAIYMSHVLEHLEMPRVTASLREARRTLASGRVLRVVVPNAASWLHAYASQDDAFFDVVYKAWSIDRSVAPLDVVMSYLGGSDSSEDRKSVV